MRNSSLSTRCISLVFFGIASPPPDFLMDGAVLRSIWGGREGEPGGGGENGWRRKKRRGRRSSNTRKPPRGKYCTKRLFCTVFPPGLWRPEKNQTSTVYSREHSGRRLPKLCGRLHRPGILAGWAGGDTRSVKTCNEVKEGEESSVLVFILRSRMLSRPSCATGGPSPPSQTGCPARERDHHKCTVALGAQGGGRGAAAAASGGGGGGGGAGG